jgi:hypothetical protein
VSNFQHHPDDLIFVRTEAGTYMDTIANFQTDYSSSYPGLPNGYIGRYYEPGVSHYVTTGDTAVSEALSWAEGDAYIAAYDTLVAAKAAREAAAATAALT